MFLNDLNIKRYIPEAKKILFDWYKNISGNHSKLGDLVDNEIVNFAKTKTKKCKLKKKTKNLNKFKCFARFLSKKDQDEIWVEAKSPKGIESQSSNYLILNIEI